MPLYVVLSTFTEQGRSDIKHTSDRLDRLSPVADKLGVKVVANAITMGSYDVVTVFEAPNDEVIAQVIGTVLARGFVTTQTMRGFSVEEFRKHDGLHPPQIRLGPGAEGHVAAVDAHELAGHEAGLVAGQERHHVGDVLGCPDASDRLRLAPSARSSPRCRRRLGARRPYAPSRYRSCPGRWPARECARPSTRPPSAASATARRPCWRHRPARLSSTAGPGRWRC